MPKIVLMYHGIRENEGQIAFNYHGNQLRVKSFAWQMSFVKSYFQVISLDDMVYGRWSPKGKTPLAVTFDDGYENNYLLAYPVLKKYDIPATIFLTAGFIDTDNYLWPDMVEYAFYVTPVVSTNIELDGEIIKINNEGMANRISSCRKVITRIKRLPQPKINATVNKILCTLNVDPKTVHMKPLKALSWKQVNSMDRSLIAFGSHTLNHCILTCNDDVTCIKELEESKHMIEDKTQIPVIHFCYPNGSHDEKTIKLVRDAGYKSACTTINNLFQFNPYAIERLWCLDNYNKLKYIWNLYRSYK